LHDLSLYLLELLENSVRAGATVVATRIVADRDADALTISVEDDGRGLPVAPEQALDPFFTTKTGKRTGLGLSLFRQEAEAAGGRFEIGGSALGGTAVTARMSLDNVDRPPLGDVATTLTTMAMTNPDVEFHVELVHGRQRVALQGDDVRRRHPALSQYQQRVP
jgi:anti-sigma regulatory factor (Ser/Thr protein kinase)